MFEEKLKQLNIELMSALDKADEEGKKVAELKKALLECVKIEEQSEDRLNQMSEQIEKQEAELKILKANKVESEPEPEDADYLDKLKATDEEQKEEINKLKSFISELELDLENMRFELFCVKKI